LLNCSFTYKNSTTFVRILLYQVIGRLLTCTVLVAGGDLRQAGGQHSQLIVLTRVPSVPTLKTVQAYRVETKLYFEILLVNVPEFS
jgi:hypothetical protein